MSETSQTAGQVARALTFRNGGWLFLALAVVSVGATASLFWQQKQRVGDGQHVDSYGFDLSTTLVAREEILASGMPRDYLPVATHPRTLTAEGVEQENERRPAYHRFLVKGDRVIGVAIKGEARAYPISAMEYREVINDTVGGREIVVTYNPLCESVVVMAREAGGRTMEFGASGLVYNSALLLYDKQARQEEQSLWCALQGRAIAGPAAARGERLELLNPQVMTWGQWRQEYPQTTVAAPDREAERRFDKMSYAAYRNTDELKFPVHPAWNPERWPRKTPVAAVRAGGGTWRVLILPALAKMTPEARAEAMRMEGATLRWHEEVGSVTAEAEAGGRVETVYAYLFAWQAMRPEAMELTPSTRGQNK